MSIKILLADDSITIQKVIGIIFGGEDYSLTVVDNGRAAVEKARETFPDILLIDALMPGMSGYEVCEQVRAIPELAQKPILLLTGSFEPFDEEKASRSGADDFIAKPFESQQIVSKVKALCELGATRSTAPAATFDQVLEPALDDSIFESAAAELPEQPVAPPAADFFEFNATPDDIWGAFTPPAEPAPVAPAPQAAASQLESDAYAIVNEESEAQVLSSKTYSSPGQETVDSQWAAVEEHIFEFEDDGFVEPAVAFSEPPEPVEKVAFGEVSFSEVGEFVTGSAPGDGPPEDAFISAADSFAEIPPAAEQFQPAEDFSFAEFPFELAEPIAEQEPTTPAFTESASPPLRASVPQGASQAVAPVANALSEDQVKAALAGLSQEVIERIVWEVVPDLAEVLIKEAIRKIKEGL